jgi:Bacterial capsule synthesis protein PGA_cap
VTPTIALLGDVMLGRAVAERLAEVEPEEVWSAELRELCGSCDLVISNLECCISGRGTPTDRVRGKPFFFRAPPTATRSLRAIGVGEVGLANNHALRLRSGGADRHAGKPRQGPDRGGGRSPRPGRGQGRRDRRDGRRRLRRRGHLIGIGALDRL